jgi:FkbM family methyltransferase
MELSHQTPRRIPGQRRVMLIVAALINLALYAAIYHAAHSPAFLIAGKLRHLLEWALGFNIISSGLILIFAHYAGWWERFERLFFCDLVISVLPFGLIVLLKVPDTQRRTAAFGLLYSVFVFSKLVILVFHSFSNVNTRTNIRPIRIWIFMVSALVYVVITPWAQFGAWPTADEPHYLLLSHSLVFDHDFNLANNYLAEDYKKYYPFPMPSNDHHALRNIRGEEVPIHDVGLPILLVPGYALAGRRGAMLEMNVFSAFLALGIFELALVFEVSTRAALIGWALFAFTSPLIVYSSQIYPEVVGAAGALWSVIAYNKVLTTLRRQYFLWIGFLLSILPWFSVRYWIITGCILGVIALHQIVLGGRRNHFPWLPTVLLGAPLLASLVLFGLFDWNHYQTPIPNAGYVLLMRSWPPSSMFSSKFIPGLLGLFLDRAFGMLPTAPVYLLALSGAWIACERKPWQAFLIFLPAIAYALFGAVNRFWYGGWAPPSRYLFLSAALLAPLASLVTSKRTPRAISFVLVAWSIFIAIAYTAFPWTRYTFWDVNAGALSEYINKRIGMNFGLIFPSFIRASGWDYLLAGLWGAAVTVCVWTVIRRNSGPLPNCERELMSTSAEQVLESRIPRRPWEGTYDPVASGTDIFYCFRLLLGRLPSAEESRLHSWRVGQDVATVVKAYLNSLEFADRHLMTPAPTEYEIFQLADFAMYLSRSDLAVGLHIANSGSYEPHVTRILSERLRSGMTFLDIGANIGYFSLFAASLVGPAGKIISIEPNPSNAKALHASADLNAFRQIRVVQAAAGACWEMLLLTPGYSNGVVSPANGSIQDLLPRETVLSCPVDAIVGTAKVDLIKIDVEGFEFRALTGASELIERHHPAIITEFTPGALPGISGVSPTEYLQFFVSRGYEISVLEHDRAVRCGTETSMVMSRFEASGADHIDLLCLVP